MEKYCFTQRVRVYSTRIKEADPIYGIIVRCIWKVLSGSLKISQFIEETGKWRALEGSHDL